MKPHDDGYIDAIGAEDTRRLRLALAQHFPDGGLLCVSRLDHSEGKAAVRGAMTGFTPNVTVAQMAELLAYHALCVFRSASAMERSLPGLERLFLHELDLALQNERNSACKVQARRSEGGDAEGGA